MSRDVPLGGSFLWGGMTETKAPPKETAKAAQAFADYYALGANRSLEKLTAQYVENGHVGKPSAIVRQLERWSAYHHWQARINQRIADQLESAAELDAESFQITTQKLRKIIEWAERLDDVVKIRETVRVGKASNVGVGINAAAGSIVFVFEEYQIPPPEGQN